MPQLLRVKHSTYGMTLTLMKQANGYLPPLSPPAPPPPGCNYHGQPMQCG